MNYQEVIKETVEELSKLEKKIKDLKGRDGVRFLRLLKIGEAASQKQAGRMIRKVEELKADAAKYTDVEPIIQISDVKIAHLF